MLLNHNCINLYQLLRDFKILIAVTNSIILIPSSDDYNRVITVGIIIIFIEIDCIDGGRENLFVNSMYKWCSVTQDLQVIS